MPPPAKGRHRRGQGAPEYYGTGTVFRLFVWNCRNCPGNLVFIFRVKMDDALVRAAAEMKLRIAERLDERSVNQCIYVLKNLAQTSVSENFLVCKPGIAPYVLAGLLLYAAGKFREGLDLIEGVSPGECNIRELVCLDDIQNILDIHLASPLEVP